MKAPRLPQKHKIQTKDPFCFKSKQKQWTSINKLTNVTIFQTSIDSWTSHRNSNKSTNKSSETNSAENCNDENNENKNNNYSKNSDINDSDCIPRYITIPFSAMAPTTRLNLSRVTPGNHTLRRKKSLTTNSPVAPLSPSKCRPARNNSNTRVSNGNNKSESDEEKGGEDVESNYMPSDNEENDDQSVESKIIPNDPNDISKVSKESDAFNEEIVFDEKEIEIADEIANQDPTNTEKAIDARTMKIKKEKQLVTLKMRKGIKISSVVWRCGYFKPAELTEKGKQLVEHCKCL